MFISLSALLFLLVLSSAGSVDASVIVPRRGSGGGGGGHKSHKKPVVYNDPSVITSTPNFTGIDVAPFSFRWDGKSLMGVPFGEGTSETAKAGPTVGATLVGREVGGGRRGSVLGNQIYGSGYPDDPSNSVRGVQGRKLPFVFYPVTYALPRLTPPENEAYLYAGEEYTKPENGTRPGGSLVFVHLTAATKHNNTSSTTDNTTTTSTTVTLATTSTTSAASSTSSAAVNVTSSTFVLLADLDTTTYLSKIIPKTCYNSTGYLKSGVITQYSSGSPPEQGGPKPQEAIQYYRGSSVVLMVVGYDQSKSLAENVDLVALKCINETIGKAVPLVGTLKSSGAVSSVKSLESVVALTVGVVGLVLVGF